MKKIYCKYCGLELERGSCTCEQFLSTGNKKTKGKKLCDTCDRKIDEDAVYCPYCGIPQEVDGNIKSLQKELRGENAVDVLEFYRNKDRKKGIKASKVKSSKLTFVIAFILVLMMVAISFTTFLLPIVKEKIADYQLKKELESAAIVDNIEFNSTEESEETSQLSLDLKDMWVRRDGYFYAFDKNGDPVVDEWVTETDVNGEEKKYYFDIEGRLVVDSWIDGEYYVGSDGAMLKDQATPDGAYVDQNGKVLLQEGQPKPDSNLRLSSYGEIRGVAPGKKYELYVKDLRQEKETIKKGELECNIIYYVPIIDGDDEREVKNINDQLEDSFTRFKNDLVDTANSDGELPKSIVFNVIEQRTLNSNRMNILTHGKITPRKGLTYKKKYRFIYDRKSKKITIADITE